MKILVVDDNKESLYLLEIWLKGNSYEVVSAANGMEALEKLRAEGFDMIISDILMPVMDGFRLCLECKEDEKLKDIPFVFYTATYTDAKDEELALKVGADKFIRKPTEPEEFIKIIQGIIKDVEEGKVGQRKPVVEEEKEVSKLYSERLIAKLEKKMLDLEAETAWRKQAQERIEHLNRVLHAIRGVNQLIVKEKDRQRLLKGVCNNLTKTGGYYNAWIAILDESGRLVTYAEAGLGEDFLPVVEQLKHGELVTCGRQALVQAGVVVIKDPFSTCSDCPLAKKYYGRWGMAIRLEYNEKVYGLLVTSIPAEFVADEEEQSLLREVAGDIAFALHDMELEEERKQAAEEFENIFNLSPDMLGIFTTGGELIRVNPSWETILGYKTEELLEVGWATLVHPDDVKRTNKEVERQLKGSPVVAFINRYKCKDGSYKTLEWQATFAKEGTVYASARDITERKKAEEKIRESEEKYRTLFESMLNGFAYCKILVDENNKPIDFIYLEINDAFEQLTGLRRENVVGKKVSVAIPGTKEANPELFDTYGKVALTGEPTEFEIYFKPLSIWFHISVYSPQKGYFVAVFENITERKRAEEALRLQAEIIANMSEGVYLVRASDGVIAYTNPKFEKMFGYEPGEMIGKYVSIVNAPTEKSPEETSREIMEFMAKTGVWEGEIQNTKKDGTPFWCYASVSYFDHPEHGRVLVAVHTDITERKQAEERIKHAAEEWRITFDSITDLVSICDKDFKLVRVNKAFADVFKMKPQEVIGKPCYTLVHGTNEPASNCPYKQTLKDGKSHMAEYFEPHLGMHLEESISPILNEKGEVVACVHLIRDITERKKMEEQLIVTDRLASVGELASGIAHELNNPLTSVIGFSQLLLEKDVPDDVKEDVKIIYSEAQRTAAVVKNLLTFARKHDTEKQPANINSIIEKVLELRTYEQKVSNIQVNTQFASDLPEIMADFFQLQQVFLNIVINAEHFMIEAHNRGTLTITTERAGDIIRVSFADDGPGIAKENLGHLFDLFFTTKEVGKGTGLGLSICHGIITKHGGRTYAESELGKGATFIVELPITIDKKGTVK